MEFSIQHLKFKILPWSQGFSAVELNAFIMFFSLVFSASVLMAGGV